MALQENPGPEFQEPLIGSKKYDISAHSSNISAQPLKKTYAQLNKKLAKSALYNIIPCFAFFSMI